MEYILINREGDAKIIADTKKRFPNALGQIQWLEFIQA